MVSLGRLFPFVALLVLACSAVSGQDQSLDYVKKGYNPPPLSGATRCNKNYVGNTPATCPPSAGVPRTDEGKDGSTVCIATADGKSFYEGVFSLSYPAKNAIPWCTSDSQCGTNPSVVCGTNGPNGIGNTCFPLAPSGCPFTGDTVNSTTTAAAGRKLRL